MKKLYLFLMLLLPALGFAQTITVSGAGTALYGDVNLNGTYSFAGIVNGKNSYSTGMSYVANGCQNCSGTETILWDGTAWILTAQGSGQCYYCNFSTTTYRTNTTATTLNPPCSGWPGSMTLSGSCEGGAIGGYALSVSSVCQTGSVTLSWTNDVAMGGGNVFTATLSDRYGAFNAGSITLGTTTSTSATSMTVTIPSDLEPGSGYKIRLSASQAPSAPYTVFSSAITIGSPGSRPNVYDEVYAFCAGESATLPTTSTYNSYQWYKVASNVYTIIPGATAQSYSIASTSVSDAGNYVVQGKSANGCLSEKSYALYVTVSPGPSISYFSNSYVSTCEGNTSSYFSLNMNGAGSFTYDWKKGATSVKTETTAATTTSYTPIGGWQVADAGQYTVVVSKVGCTNSTTSQIADARVDAPIITPPSVAPTGTQVAPVTLTATSGFPLYNLYKWNGSSYDFNNNSYGNTFNITQSGKYVVAVVNNCGVSGYSNEVTVTSICDTPPTITPAAPSSLPATLTASTGYNSYEWYKWNGSSYAYIGSGSNSINVTTFGQYAVRGYSYGCGYSDFSPSVTVAVLCATNQSGDSGNPDIWSCGRVPVATDNAKIEAGHTVNLSAGIQNVNQLTNNGTLTGSGSIGGSLYNNGTIAPGNSPGMISVLDFTGTVSSVINAEISTQSAYDKLAVTGAAALNGILNVVFIDAFVPTLGDAFEFISYGSHSGTFTTINLPVLPSGIVWKTEYNATALKLSVIVNPLPVTLLSFSANVTDDQLVKLVWATAEEINASHFFVERSADAKEFEIIGKVYASGTSKLRKDYFLTDETPLPATSYYRLRQVDMDEKESIYRVIAVHLDAAFSQVVFPNPTSKDAIQMTFKGALPGIELTDLNGRRIPLTLSQTALSTLMIKPSSSLAPGLYILTAEHGSMQVRHKVVIGE